MQVVEPGDRGEVAPNFAFCKALAMQSYSDRPAGEPETVNKSGLGFSYQRCSRV